MRQILMAAILNLEYKGHTATDSAPFVCLGQTGPMYSARDGRNSHNWHLALVRGRDPVI